MEFQSKVPGHEGECRPTWVNRNQVDNWQNGGVTGFFRNLRPFLWFRVKTGPEFHGIIRGREVHSTQPQGKEELK